MRWNDTVKALEYRVDADVVIQIGRESLRRVTGYGNHYKWVGLYT